MATKGKLIGKMVIGQSGGPTAVINQSLVGAVPVSYTHLLANFLNLNRPFVAIAKNMQNDLDNSGLSS